MHRYQGNDGQRHPEEASKEVARPVALSTAAYGIEEFCEGHKWPHNGLDKISKGIGQAVAGTFSTVKGEDAIRAGNIPPTGPAPDRRRERLLMATLAAPEGTLKHALLPSNPEDDSCLNLTPS